MRIKSQFVRVNLKKIEQDKIRTIIDVLRKGGVIAYPTDTFYGLGANCYVREAVLRIYSLKKRALSKPLSVVVADMNMAERLAVEIPPLFRLLASKFWPGPLTLVLRASSSLPRELLSPEGTVGMRVPASPWLQKLIKEAGFPLTATSANISGKAELSDPAQVIKVFDGKADMIIDGGTTPGGAPSTVVDLSSGKPKIIREGALPAALLEKYLKND